MIKWLGDWTGRMIAHTILWVPAVGINMIAWKHEHLFWPIVVGQIVLGFGFYLGVYVAEREAKK